MSTLNLSDLHVTSFQTADDTKLPTDDKCCTGCDSGCGIIPTGGGCVSAEETQHQFCYPDA